MKDDARSIYDRMKPRDDYWKVVAALERDCARFHELYHAVLVPSRCPACTEDGPVIFHKFGFEHRRCDRCRTLYCSMRPPEEYLARFYQEFEFPKLWTSLLLKTDAERKAIQCVPRVQRIVEFLKAAGVSSEGIAVDVGCGSGAFAITLQRSGYFRRVIGVDLSESCVAAARQQGVESILGSIEALEESLADLIVCNELIEHLFDPAPFLSACHRVLRPGGVLCLSTPNGEGFDFVVMGELTRNISPPAHLNYFNPDSITLLLERTGFASRLVETPGKLDVDIVEREREKGYTLTGTNGWLSFLFEKDATVLAAFQEFLVQQKLSSHLLVFAQRV
jgi:SAM-dependent methyltransferase